MDTPLVTDPNAAPAGECDWEVFIEARAPRRNRRRESRLTLALCCLLVVAAGHAAGLSAPAQEPVPTPPADRSPVYYAAGREQLVPLPFEVGRTPLRLDAPAKSNKTSYVELKGKRAATVITDDRPRFYLFLDDRQDARAPFLVRLTEAAAARRVTAVAERGQSGFAVPVDEIVQPHYRVIRREGGVIFMEVSPRAPLAPGEYAFVGLGLERVATFRVELR